MKKRFTGMIAGLVAVALFAGCETTKPASGDADKDKVEKKDPKQLVETLRPSLTEAEKIALAEGILEKMVDGINKDDYSLYTNDFFKGLKEQVKEKEWKASNDDLKKQAGDYEARFYMGMLNKPLVDVFIWKGKFTKNEGDVLIRLGLIEDEGKYKVTIFSISPF